MEYSGETLPLKQEADPRFADVRFCGTFRSYQQRALDCAQDYLKDGKINIVAAPGSGKTVLGLELIARLSSPCLILSPTTTIREQWGERFLELFLPDRSKFGEYFSNDLHRIRLINSVTYQALYSSVEKVCVKEEGEADCSDIDLFAVMKAQGIKTVCLDEAHHLKNEWQKALEKFVSMLDRDVTLISLTATPPYDSEKNEWDRYRSLCGEIDEEIFVPELVGQNTLCPHQDYVYFNYPTKEETKAFEEHTERAEFAVLEISSLPFFGRVCNTVNGIRDYEMLFANVKEYVALLVLLQRFGYEAEKKTVKELTAGRGLPSFDMRYAETALGFLLNGALIADEEKEAIISVLKKHSVYDKRRVTLATDERLKRTLISSAGKLDSIGKIAQSELAVMGEKLRMLVLTDYIKKESLAEIASEKQFASVNCVSIFETIRCKTGSATIGVLSGSLVILPDSVDLSSVRHRREHLDGTEYSVVSCYGSNRTAVELVGKLLERGEINILVGTKSLLGEGWDSPCINSLVLASSVGSFVLSNQMRGRAIRIDQNDPDKVSNIWHLVTLEPEHLFREKWTDKVRAIRERDKTVLTSYDFETLKRRFDCFMGPNYTTGTIESGIERITAIKPPYDKKGVEAINETMLSLSAKRSDVRRQWQNEVSGKAVTVATETAVPTEKRIPIFSFLNFYQLALLFTVDAVCLGLLPRYVRGDNWLWAIAMLIVCLSVGALAYIFKRAIIHASPVRSMKALGNAVYETLRDCGLIAPQAKVDVQSDKDSFYCSLFLRNATVHDQNVFNTAMTELLSPIENPRYLLIAKNRRGKYHYRLSFACPSVIGKKKEYVAVLTEKLKASTGRFEAVYVYREDGRKIVLKCRQRSYLTLNERAVNKKYKVSYWE